MKISFTAVTAQHMLLLCVKMSRDNLNSAFGRLVLWCLFFDNKDAVGKTYPERMEWVFLQRLPSRLGCFWHTDICSRCFQLTVIMLKNKWTFFRISSTNIDVAAVWKGWRYRCSGRRGAKTEKWWFCSKAEGPRPCAGRGWGGNRCLIFTVFPGCSPLASPRTGSQNGAWGQGQRHRLPTAHRTGCHAQEKR